MAELCRICEAPAASRVGNIEGFRAKLFFDVIRCASCETHYVDPLTVDERIYNAIYGHASVVSGYDRYVEYAEQITGEKNPLAFLMNREDAYWGVGAALRAHKHSIDRDALILEVGCGQGYLTYALRNAGYNAIGVDVSENAVALARKRFGPHYFTQTARQFVDGSGRPRVIVATEVIEHLPDPLSFAGELLDCVAPGGVVVLTTPNRETCPPEVVWHTDLPPVHLWWFTMRGLEGVARRLGASIQPVDMDGFYRKNLSFKPTDFRRTGWQLPCLDENYLPYETKAEAAPKPNLRATFKAHMKRALPATLLREIRARRARRAGKERVTGKLPTTLCVCMSRA